MSSAGLAGPAEPSAEITAHLLCRRIALPVGKLAFMMVHSITGALFGRARDLGHPGGSIRALVVVLGAPCKAPALPYLSVRIGLTSVKTTAVWGAKLRA